MALPVRRTQIIASIPVLDFVMITALFVSGSIAIWISSQPGIWNQMTESRGQGAALGSVFPKIGSLRLKHANSNVWLDVNAPEKTYEGDSVATGESSSAILTLTGNTRIKLASDSLIVLHLEKGDSVDVGTGAPLQFWQTLSARPSSLEVKRGAIRVESAPSKTTLKVTAKGKVYQFENSTLSNNEHVVADPRGEEEIESRPAQPVVPTHLSPVHETHFTVAEKALASFNLSWEELPEGLETEVQIVKADSAIDSVPQTLRASRRGIHLQLGEGTYHWKVRSLQASTRQPSAWTREFEFKIGHIPPNPMEVAVLKAAEVTPPVTSAERTALEAKHAELLRREAEAKAEVAAKAAVQLKQRRLAQEEAARRARLREIAESARVNAASAKNARIEQKKVVAIQVQAPQFIQRSPAKASTALGSGEIDLTKLTVHLRWGPIPGSKNYALTLYRNRIATNTVTVVEPAYDFVLNSLEDGVQFAYQVATTDSANRKISSALTPIDVSISPPNPVSPSNGSTIAESDINLTWASTVLTSEYEIQVANDLDFSKITLSRKVSVNLISISLPEPGTYYWRVRGKSEKSTSAWSLPSVLIRN